MNSINFSVWEQTKILMINKLFYYKYLHPYLFAHKPLCEKFNADTITIGHIYICKSCFYLYCGVITAIVLSFIAKMNYIHLLSLTAITAFLSNPIYYNNYSRITRNIARFTIGFLTVTLLIDSFQNSFILGTVVLLLLLKLKNLYNKKRAEKDICKGCTESLLQKTCSGYEKQTEALLKLEEVTSNYIMNLKGDLI